MADVFFVCVEDCWLKRVLEDNGKLKDFTDNVFINTKY